MLKCGTFSFYTDTTCYAITAVRNQFIPSIFAVVGWLFGGGDANKKEACFNKQHFTYSLK